MLKLLTYKGLIQRSLGHSIHKGVLARLKMKNKKVPYTPKEVDAEVCLSWYYVKCADISVNGYPNIDQTLCYSLDCIDPEEVLRAAKELQNLLEFIMKQTPDNPGKLGFLDLKIYFDRTRK